MIRTWAVQHLRAGRARFWPALIAVAACLTATEAHAAPASGAAVAAEKVWSQLLTHCGESYFYAGSAFDGMSTMHMFAGDPTLIEFRGAKFHTVPIRVTDAERQNGLTEHARITMFGHTYRKKGEPWQDGPDLIYRNIEDVFSRSWKDVQGDEGQLGIGGAIALDLKEANGHWWVQRSSVILSDTLGGDRGADLATFSQARVARYNCQTGEIIPPPPTAEELRAAAEVRAEAARRAADEAARQKEIAEARADLAARDANDAAARSAQKADQDRKLAPWSFTGGPAEFRQALAANLARRAPQFGLDPNSYGAEFDRIDQIVANCLAITPDDWRRIQAQYDQGMAVVGHQAGPNPVFLRNQQLSWCDATRGSDVIGERVSDPGREHGLGVIKSLTIWDRATHAPRPTGYFAITVTVLPNKGELNKNGPITMADIPPLIDVIVARIPMPAWTHEEARR